MTQSDRLQPCLLEYNQWLPASVRDLSLDSREIQPGDVFIALCGERAHGLDFAAEAIARGASVVLFEPNCRGETVEAPETDVPMVGVQDLRQRLPKLAQCFYRDPSADVCVAGVTGTNGKTSITWLTSRALQRAGQSCGLLGTLGMDTGRGVQATPNTTPDVIRVNRFLAACREQDVRKACMEVSSHALLQERVAGIRIRHAVFTHLSRDHLDAHGSMEQYGATKARLLQQPGLESVWLNSDDDWCRSLRHQVPATVHMNVYGQQTLKGARIHLQARQVRLSLQGLSFEMQVNGEAFSVQTPLMGRFNVDNLLATAGLLHDFGLDWPEIAQQLSRSEPVPGRMQALPARRNGPAVVLDFAHTPDALQQVLENLRQHVCGRLWCVFGCGGSRDQGKRPIMGAVAEQMADVVVVTADNPRNEFLSDINAAILSGMKQPQTVQVIEDRRQAVLQALQQAGPEDLVLLAGKGHEEYQEIRGQRMPYSDASVVAEWREDAA